MSDIRLFAKQADFVYAPELETWYSGAIRSGKTVALCVALCARASVPGSREGLFRKHLADLKTTTLKTLLQGDGLVPPVLGPGTYTQNKADRTIRLRNGGEIVYNGIEDARSQSQGGHKHLGLTLSGAAIDQAEQWSEDEYDMLMGRVSMTLPGLPRRIYAVCNPDAPTHWAAKRFGMMHSRPIPGVRRIMTTLHDNPYLEPAYVAKMEARGGWWADRYVWGRWVGAEGVVYDNFRVAEHVRTGMNTDIRRRLIGVDDGNAVPFAAVAADEDWDGRLHVVGLHYRAGMLSSDKVAAVLALGGKDAIVVVDPAAAGLEADLRAAGVRVEHAENDVRSGIAEVRQRWERDEAGRPMLSIDPSCVDLIDELGTYRWDEGKDKPVKEHDHACDALRYLVMRTKRGRDAVTPSNTPTRIIMHDREQRGDIVTTGIDSPQLVMMRGDRRWLLWDNGSSWTLWGSQREWPHRLAVGVVMGMGDRASHIKIIDPVRRVPIAAWSGIASPEHVAHQVAGACWLLSNQTGVIACKRDGLGLECIRALRRIKVATMRGDDGELGLPHKADDLRDWVSTMQTMIQTRTYEERSQAVVDDLHELERCTAGMQTPGGDDPRVASSELIATLLALQAMRRMPREMPPHSPWASVLPL